MMDANYGATPQRSSQAMPAQWSSGSPGLRSLIAAGNSNEERPPGDRSQTYARHFQFTKRAFPVGLAIVVSFASMKYWKTPDGATSPKDGQLNAVQGSAALDPGEDSWIRRLRKASRSHFLKTNPKRKEPTMDEILITGGKVVLRSVQETKTVTVDDFYAALSQSAGLRTPVLPERVIFYAAKGERRLYLTHQHPAVKTIKVRNADDEITEYSLSLPHVYFIHHYFNCAMESLYVFCSGEAISDSADMLYKLPLKNIHGDGLVCIGDDLKFSLEGRLDDKLETTENFFWESVFNSDLDSCFKDALPEVFKRGMSPRESADPLSVWERLSTEIGFQVSEVKWNPFSKLSEIATDLLED